MKTKNKCKKHDPQSRHLLERPVANSGPMNQQQIKAMWAKKTNPQPPAAGATPQRTFIPVPRVPIPGYPKQPPPQNGTVAIREQPTPPAAPRDPMQDVWDRINRIRQGLPADPPIDTSHPPLVPLSTTPGMSSPPQGVAHPWPVGTAPVTVARPSPFPVQPVQPPFRHGPVAKPTQPPLRHGPVLLKPTPVVGPPVKNPALTTSSFWKGKTPDPALKKKLPHGGHINNRFAAAIGFLRDHGAPVP